MRIAYLLQKFADPYEPWLYDQMEVLLEHGHEIHFFTQCEHQGTSLNGSTGRHKQLGNVFSITGSENYPENSKASTAWNLLKLFLIDNKSCRNILNQRGNGDLGLRARMAVSFRKFIGEASEYDVVYASPADVAIDILPFLDPGHRFIVGCQGNDIFRFEADALGPVFERADAVVSVSSYCFDRIRSLGCSEEKIRAIPFGVDLARFSYRQRPPRKEGEKIRLLSTGRFAPEKGFQVAIEAIAQLADQFDLEYTLVGSGGEEQKLRSLVNKYGLQDSVIFAGRLGHDEIVKLLHQSHIFIGPSITGKFNNQEPYGLMIREAAATGCPVICSDIGGLSDGVIDGVTGYLVEENNPAALASGIEKMIAREPEWNEIGVKARELMEESCELKKMQNIYLHEIESHS